MLGALEKRVDATFHPLQGFSPRSRCLQARMIPMKFPIMIRLLVSSSLAVLVLSASATEPPAPPPPPPLPPPMMGEPGKDRPPHRGEGGSKERGEWRGGFPGFGRPPMRHDGFDKLPEADRQKVRDALDKVWNLPEVIAARDEAMLANEKMRDAIRENLKKHHPEAAEIVARTEPREPFDPRHLPPLPPSDAEDFPSALVERMGSELVAFARPERREETRIMHLRIMEKTELREALALLKKTRGEERIQAMHALRKAYREAVGAEFHAARERRAAAGEGEQKP